MEFFSEDTVGAFYDLLEPCKQVEQHPVWHPEGDVYIHSFQVLHHALRETNDTDLILAAWLHDVGKQIHPLGHDKESVVLLEGLVSVKTEWLVGQHMRVSDLILGRMKRRQKVLALLNHPWLPELIALHRWDTMGRNANTIHYVPCGVLREKLNFKADLHFKKERKA